MRNLCSALLAFLAAILCADVGSAEITTVIPSNNKDATFQVGWKANKQNQDLEFPLDVALPDALKNAQVTQCELYVVVNRPKGTITGQDVAVLNGTVQIGELHLGDQDTGSSYRTPLQPESCDPKNKTLKTTLQSKSPNTDWQYYGGGATNSADRPRLIVTYDAPTPAHSGDVTDWTYSNPGSFFSSRLWVWDQNWNPKGGTLLTNPVSYDGAVYLIAGTTSASTLFRVGGEVKGTTSWWLKDLPIVQGSFAFVTAWGRLQIITKDAIHSCDLKKLESLKYEAGSSACNPPATGKITVNPDETPAMGPDGSLYFKNIEPDNSIVAYNPSLQEIWRSKLKLTKVSPIALNANGRYAYVLADVPVQDNYAVRVIALLCIDTATGEIVADEIAYEDEQNKVVKPPLKEFFKPAVVSKDVNGRSVDYVFLAGNTNDTGLLQLIAFEAGTKPTVLWHTLGKVAAAPVPSVDGNLLFVAWQDGTYRRYNIAEGKTGAYEQFGNMRPISKLLVDRGASVYRDANGRLDVFPAGWKPGQLGIGGTGVGSKEFQFTNDGSLIGYSKNEVFDFSPKSAPSISPSPSPLVTNTIYSADTVTVPVTDPSNPGVKSGDQVILKGKKILFPPNFKWPVGATLKAVSIPP